MRTCAQLVSYEVALAISVLGVIIMAGSLSLTEIVDQQSPDRSGTQSQIVGLAVFFIAGIAETNRPPFDLPEAETELVAGYQTEYSGMRFGLFSMAEYINMIVLSSLAVTLFFGGWLGPWAPPGRSGSSSSSSSSSASSSGSAPPCRDCVTTSLMDFGWKILLPVATINALVTAALVIWLEPATFRLAGRLRRHAAANLQEADHAAIPGVQAPGLSALPRPRQVVDT